MSGTPLCSVWMITYNHSAYIRQAIEGVLAQQTNFSYKLYIGEDNSPDNTLQICREYQEKYPDRIELLPTDKNLGAVENGKRVYKACALSGAKYIAFCEGDDYWTDSSKLQKQVDLLEARPDISLCFHTVDTINTMGEHIPVAEPGRDVYTLQDLLAPHSWLAMTCSMVIRSTITNNIPSWFFETVNGDFTLQLLAANEGSLFCLHQTMATYRLHQTGISQQFYKTPGKIELELIKLYGNFNKHTGGRHTAIIDACIARLQSTRLDKQYAHLRQEYSTLAHLNDFITSRKIFNAHALTKKILALLKGR